MSKRGFTLIEVLVVTAILAVLAGLLLPVFTSARASAYKAACASNLRQLAAGSNLYSSDYDDRFVIVSYAPNGPQNSRTDRTWVQMLLPYLNNFRVFNCPSDTSALQTQDSTFDQDLVPGDSYSAYYTMSQHVDYGYNFQYLSPVFIKNGEAESQPRTTSMAETPSRSILFVDSVHDRDAAGNPIDGGNWLVVPPCRFYAADNRSRPVDTFSVAPGTQLYTPTPGWTLQERNSSSVYGGAWPWHKGQMNVVMIDGSIHSLTPTEIGQGCDLRPEWRGWIRDLNQYLWNLR